MIIYQIIGHPLDCEGYSLPPKVIKSYTSLNDAEKYKKAWLELWDKHKNNHELISPCLYDYKKWLNINEVEVEEKFTGI